MHIRLMVIALPSNIINYPGFNDRYNFVFERNRRRLKLFF